MKSLQIGYGIIGKIWYQIQQQEGRTLSIWNRSALEIPGYTPDLAHAASSADLIHICISDPPAVDAVLRQLLPVLEPRHIIIQSSTISPEWATKNKELVETKGAHYVEAPFTGSKLAAEARKVVFFLGGTTQAKARAKEYLQPLFRAAFDLDTVEKASAIKLALNLHIAAIGISLGESLHLARTFGISDSQYFELLSHNVAHSGLADLKQPKLMESDFSPHFSVKHMHKDIALAAQTMKDHPLVLNDQVIQIYRQGIQAGLGDCDFSALIQLLKT